jgi:hypothetical protein
MCRWRKGCPARGVPAYPGNAGIPRLEASIRRAHGDRLRSGGYQQGNLTARSPSGVGLKVLRTMADG